MLRFAVVISAVVLESALAFAGEGIVDGDALNAVSTRPASATTGTAVANCQSELMRIRQAYAMPGKGPNSPQDILRIKCGFCHDSSPGNLGDKSIERFASRARKHIENGRAAFDIKDGVPFTGFYVKNLYDLLQKLQSDVKTGTMPPSDFVTGHSTVEYFKSVESWRTVLAGMEAATDGPLGSANPEAEQVLRRSAEEREKVTLSPAEKERLNSWADLSLRELGSPSCQSLAPSLTELSRLESKLEHLQGSELDDEVQNFMKAKCLQCHTTKWRPELLDLTNINEFKRLKRVKTDPSRSNRDLMLDLLKRISGKSDKPMPPGNGGAEPVYVKLFEKWLKERMPSQ